MNVPFILCSFLISVLANHERERVGNPDDNAKIERPCPVYDLNCIRTFFANHAHCKKTFGPVPDPLYRPQDVLYYSKSNFTLTILDQRTSGLNGRIEEFYINPETDKLVIAVEFTNVSQGSDNIFFKFNRRAKEPVVTQSFYTVRYNSVIITAVIPKVDDLQLYDSECTAFVNDLEPVYTLGPSALESSDPQPALAIADATSDAPTYLKEMFLTESAFFIASYIQYNICDFGLLLT